MEKELLLSTASELTCQLIGQKVLENTPPTDRSRPVDYMGVGPEALWQSYERGDVINFPLANPNNELIRALAS